ncbi:MAG: YerC/YecD family TrpR-related protein [Clostridia bacterium]|nr:YerC/YecD family TrpR-related protein [Clostridia bacterium]
MQDLYNESFDNLMKVISMIDSQEECRKFFEDLCTIKELQDMAQRFETAVLLDKGLSYSKISQQVGVSTATITRVNRCLSYGSGGYENAIMIYKGEKK